MFMKTTYWGLEFLFPFSQLLYAVEMCAQQFPYTQFRVMAGFPHPYPHQEGNGECS